MADPAEYTCEACGETYARGWSDEEAKAEFAGDFGADHAIEDAAIICDDCYRKMFGLPPA